MSAAHQDARARLIEAAANALHDDRPVFARVVEEGKQE